MRVAGMRLEVYCVWSQPARRNCGRSERHFARLIAIEERDVVLFEIGGDEKESDGEGDGPQEELDGEGTKQGAAEERAGMARGESEEQSGGEADRGGEGKRFQRAGEASLPVRAGEQEEGAAEEKQERGEAQQEADALREFAEEGGHMATRRSGWGRRAGDV